MILGFHYHIPVQAVEGSFKTQSFFGLFLDALANECTELVILSYTPINSELPLMNYTIKSRNIKIVELGPHASLPKRIFSFLSYYRKIVNTIKYFDVFLIRSPTPLIVFFPLIVDRNKTVLYIVGDYIESAKTLNAIHPKTWLIKLFNTLTNIAQNSLIRNRIVLTNSIDLANRLKTTSKEVSVIKSTTLRSEDFYFRKDFSDTGIYKLLYTGRIDPAKGLTEIVNACKELAAKGMRVEFHIAGMTVKGMEDYPNNLIAMGRTYNIEVIYHGLKNSGAELNALYRAADVYVIGSKGYEGFPRTIWEAMSNGLPVIATRVGSIPYFLKDRQDAVLVNANSVNELANGLYEILSSTELRQTLTANGYKLSKENTLDIQAKSMVSILNKISKNE